VEVYSYKSQIKQEEYNMSYFDKYQGIVGLGTESTFGAGGATVKEWCNVTDYKFNLEIANEPLKAITGIRESEKSVQGRRMLDGNVAFDLENNNGLGVIFRSHFGTVNSAQIGTFLAYKHVFSIDQNPDIISLFARVNQLGTNMKNYVGLFPSKIDINYGKDEDVKVSVDFMGQNEATGTFVNGTYGTFQPFTTYENLQVWIDGTVNPDIVSLKCTLDAKGQKIATVGTNSYISKITKGGEISPEVSFDILFTGETERNKFLNNTVSTLQLKLSGVSIAGTAVSEMNIKIPAFKYKSFPFEDKEGGVRGATVAGFGLKATNAVGTGCVLAEIVNAVSGY